MGGGCCFLGAIELNFLLPAHFSLLFFYLSELKFLGFGSLVDSAVESSLITVDWERVLVTKAPLESAPCAGV